MSKIERLKKRFTAFVNQLTPDQVREQLVLAYLQMERCQQVLRGENVEPVAMRDNGESSDLELFYLCKKTSEELAYLNQMVHKERGKRELDVSYDKRTETFLFDNLGDISKLTMSLSYLKKLASGAPLLFDTVPKFKKGREVWYLYEDRVQHGYVRYSMEGENGDTCYLTSLGHTICECDLFSSVDELFSNLRDNINGESE